MAYLPPYEASQIIPQAEGGTVNASTRTLATTFEGASYYLDKGIRANRIVFRATAFTGAPTARILIYQNVAARGSAGVVANLIATVSGFAVGAANTNFTAPFSEGTVELQPGTIYILYGRDSAAGTIAVRTVQTLTLDLFSQNLPATLYPTTFSTAISATTSPATFDPLTQAVASLNDVTLVTRLLSI